MLLVIKGYAKWALPCKEVCYMEEEDEVTISIRVTEEQRPYLYCLIFFPLSQDSRSPGKSGKTRFFSGIHQEHIKYAVVLDIFWTNRSIVFLQKALQQMGETFSQPWISLPGNV